MKLPIILYKRHEAEIKKKETEIRYLKNEIKSLKEDLILANRATNEILPKLVRLRKPILDEAFNSYRICVDLNRLMVEESFIHGNDERMIRYFARVLSHQIAQKMIEFNFVR